MKVFKKGKRIDIQVQKTGFFRRGLGLMFRSSKTQNLIFEFKHNSRAAITSYFVFFPFLIIWLDEKNRALEYKIVNPFVIALQPAKPFRKFIEVPLNAKNRRIIEFFVGKRGKI